MGVHLTSLHIQKENFLVNSLEPVYIPAGVITANDLSALTVWAEVSIASGGINAGNPASFELEYSPDDGATWYPITGCSGGVIEGAGANWVLSVTANSPIFPPLARLKFTSPAGESYRVKKIRRLNILPGMVYAPKSSATGAIPVVGFGPAATGSRVAAMMGAPTALPAPSASGFDYLTTSSFKKALANDGRALDSFLYFPDGSGDFFTLTVENVVGATRFVRNTDSKRLPTTSVMLVWDSVNNEHRELSLDANNSFPVTVPDSTFNIELPIPGVGKLPNTTSAFKKSVANDGRALDSFSYFPDGTGDYFTLTVESIVGNTRFIKTTDSKRLPTSSVMLVWDSANSEHREFQLDSNGAILTDSKYSTVLPVPGVGSLPVTTTAFKKVVANDARAFDNFAYYPDGSGDYFTITVDSLVGLAQFTRNTNGKLLPTTAVVLGWDATNSTHKELSLDPAGAVKTSAIVPDITVANPAVYKDYSATSITDAAWTEIVTSTSVKASKLQIFDSSGAVIKLATGAAASEIELLKITPGGDTYFVTVAAGTRLSIKAEAGFGTINVGLLVINMFT